MQNWTTKTNFSTKLDDRISKDRKDDKVSKDRKAGRNSTTQQQLDDKVQSGLRPSYKTRALCRQKSVPEKQPEKPQQHQPWRCQGSSWESEDKELKENTEVEEVFFDNIDKEVEEEVFDNKEEEVDEEVGSIDKEVDNIFIEVDNIDLEVILTTSLSSFR